LVSIAWGRPAAAREAVCRTSPRPRPVLALAALVFLGGALLFAAYEWRAVRKRGRLAPPSQGLAVAAGAAETRALSDLAARHRARLVWSSNRHGNHDILLMEWPSRDIRRLTRDPHAETYPRLSPDGRRVLFARSQVAWVSQRNSALWDAWIVDLDTGVERRVATNAFFASWTDGGRSIVFQRDRDREVVRRSLIDGQERVLLRTGRAPIAEGVSLQTPDTRSATGATAITLRGARRVTGWVGADGVFMPVGDGSTCQLTWATDDSLLYVGQGGRMRNIIFRHSLKTQASTALLDLPGDFSHEYFPRLSADGRLLVFGASDGGHEHDTADYEIFAWEVGTPPGAAVRITFHTGNDCWPDIWVEGEPDTPRPDAGRGQP
jgi:hypothetical protein